MWPISRVLDMCQMLADSHENVLTKIIIAIISLIIAIISQIKIS